ncbi:MAG: phenylalanine--tRNA ligase subunit beta [Candidatus Paceibacterota bacterium]
MKVSYNWLQNYFKEKLPEPEKLSEGIIFHSFEVEEIVKIGDDVIFDIKILPDRAHDCLSHFGIAKEISAIFNLKISSPNGFFQVLGSPVQDSLKEQAQPDRSKSHFGPDLKIEIQSDKCLRYMGRIVRNIKISKSPDWLREKLEAIGQKSINNIVDAANFVMFDLGQPIHCFDLDKLESAKIIVRNGKVGEKLTTLDKKEIILDESILVIADEKTPLAIAGIKGGIKAEVDDKTKNLVIEVANFDKTSTRKTSKKINILTDAVKRYENEITPELCTMAMNAITDLVFELAGGEAESIIDIYPKKVEQKKVFVSVNYINKHLGSDFSQKEIEDVWKKLNFKYLKKGDEFEIEVPFFRIDITGPHDLTEEVIRILGYDKLKEKMPEIKTKTKMNEIFSEIIFTRSKLLNSGYSEVMTYSFKDKGEVEVLASASDKKFLRTNLTDGLKESLKLNQINLPLLEMKEIKIFEIGTVFKKSGEEMHVAYGDKKEIKEMTLNEFCKDSLLEEYPLGGGGKYIHPGAGVTPQEGNKFLPWSIYPFISRDIAVWMPEGGNVKELKKILIENGTELLIKEPYLFDSFTKDSKTSYAFRLVFQSYERTLTDDEINEIMTKITNKIKEKNDWQVR